MATSMRFTANNERRARQAKAIPDHRYPEGGRL